MYIATAILDSTQGFTSADSALAFDRSRTQYIDGASHTFNIQSEGGFTALILVKFPQPGQATTETFFEFGDSTAQHNMVLVRAGIHFRFSLWT